MLEVSLEVGLAIVEEDLNVVGVDPERQKNQKDGDAGVELFSVTPKRGGRPDVGADVDCRHHQVDQSKLCQEEPSHLHFSSEMECERE